VRHSPLILNDKLRTYFKITSIFRRFYPRFKNNVVLNLEKYNIKLNNFPQSLLKADSSKAIWLLFLDKNSSLEKFFTGINIPFNSEFLVAQPDDHVVVLTEVYRVSPTLPLQTYRFGNWTPDGGLTWPSQGFYHRRNNLQGHTIRATRVNVSRKLSVYVKVKVVPKQ
jgi:hypothetical protein